MKQFAHLLALGIALAPAGGVAGEEILPPEKVFRYEVDAGADTLLVDWSIEPGHYLYRKRFGFASLTPGIELGNPDFPPGKIYTDEFFGEMEIYRDGLTLSIPYRAAAGAPEVMSLELKSQGCADIGLCYPPQTWTADVTLAGGGTPPAADTGTDLLALLASTPRFGGDDEELLPPDEAFRFSAYLLDPYTIEARWQIADDYYLYRDKFTFAADSELAQLGPPELPHGKAKYDEFFGDVEVHYQDAMVRIPLSRAGPRSGSLTLEAGYQGCNEKIGVCYAPILTTLKLELPAVSAADPIRVAAASSTGPGPVSEQDRLAALISEGSMWLVMATFFGLGLLLAFTPCVLPMIPILSGIIAGHGGGISTSRAFALSVTFVLGMALTYTVAGAAFAAAGQGVQAAFQQTWIIALFSALFVALALAMFGLYELQMPSALQSRLTAWSNRQSAGTFAGTAVMGALSALIVTACVAPPLVATLAVMGQTGDVVRGASALFALSLGMGAPLIVFGTSAGKLLPKAGPWMESVKAAFGVMLMGLAIWMLGRILPEPLTLFLWAVLALFTGVYLGALEPLPEGTRGVRRFAKGAGLLAVAYGALLLIGAAAGGGDPLQPLRGVGLGQGESVHELEFKRIKTLDDLQREVGTASAAGRPALLDFYADWCVSCKEMEKYTFTDGRVREALGSTLLLQADVTANDAADKALLKHFGIYGPPTIAFFGSDGAERRGHRVVGFMPADKFAPHVRGAFGDPVL